ncbi:MAG: shikimate dehydrogenase [Bacteroidaceae bacterium]|nr:shikimate dehydrogenase [Bacteroidaceae bacterium]
MSESTNIHTAPSAKILYGLIGFPLGHSFSRQFFTDKFQSEGIDAAYLNFEIPDARQLLDIVRVHPNLRGLNCTIPHKQAILPLLHELSPEAQRIGAVNVIRIREGRLTGYNSDIIGFKKSLRPLLQPHHHKALVLGTGGASKAICLGLEQLGLEWRYVSRTPRQGHFCYEDVTPEVLREFTVIVNCSPVGMHPHYNECPPLPYESLTTKHLLYDLVYNPEVTLFMQRGQAQGAVVKNGLEMLHLQAQASWELWNL